MLGETGLKALDCMPCAVFIFDKNLKTVFCNKRFKEIFNPAEDEFTVGGSINCANMLKEKCVCGQGVYCRGCFLNMLLKEAADKNINLSNRSLDKKVVCGGQEKNFRLKLDLNPISDGLYCCVIEKITEIFGKNVNYFSKKLNKDFERAKTIQSLMLPPLGKLKPVADFAYFYKQNYLVGGDLFDVYKYDERRFGGYIADVSGSGISAGMLTVFMHENYPCGIFSPAKALGFFAEKFNGLKLPEESYITAFAFSADTEAKKLYVCNGGHSVPALIKNEKGTKTVFLRGKTVSNWYKGISYRDLVLDYTSGDLLILMTDGIPDLKNNDGEYYTFERAKRKIENSPHSISGILKNIEIDIVEFYGGIHPENADDKALLIVELK
jgi:hypothetical protein